MNDVKEYYYNLCEVLQDELDLYKEIESIADKKTDILVDGDIDLLQEITKIEQDIIVKLGKLEDERVNLIEELSEDLKIDIDKITAKYLIEHISDTKSKKRLSNIYDKMKQVLIKIDDKNKTNANLIESALEYINFSIDLLTDVGSNETNYGANGQNTKKTFHFIDKKA